MTAPLASCGAVAAPAPVWLLGTFSWTNWSPRMVVRAMSAVTSAGMRTLLSNVSVTLAWSPSSAMLLTEPTGTSASCTWAPLARSPTSLKSAVAVRCDEPPPMEQPVEARRRARGGRGRRGGGGGGRCAHQNQLATSWAHCDEQAGLGVGGAAGPWPWLLGQRRQQPAAGAVRVGAGFGVAGVAVAVATWPASRSAIDGASGSPR